MLDGVVTNGKNFFWKSSIALGDTTFWSVFIFLKIIKKWWEIQKSKLKNYLTNWAFQNNFYNWFYRVVLFKNHLFFYINSWNFNFAVNHVTSFYRQNPLKSKNIRLSGIQSSTILQSFTSTRYKLKSYF